MPTTKKAGDANISDAAVRAKTGRTWKQWFTVLDRWGAKRKPHAEIARYLSENLKVPLWWSQMVTVEYERKKQGRKVGERPTERGFAMDVQRTVKTTAKKAYDAFLQPEHVARWFTRKAQADLRVGGTYKNADGDQGEYLALDPPNRARFTWDNKRHCPGTIVEFTILPSTPGKVAVRISHSRLKSVKDRAKMKQGWSWALDSFKSYLETGKPTPHEEWLKRQS